MSFLSLKKVKSFSVICPLLTVLFAASSANASGAAGPDLNKYGIVVFSVVTESRAFFKPIDLDAYVLLQMEGQRQYKSDYLKRKQHYAVHLEPGRYFFTAIKSSGFITRTKRYATLEPWNPVRNIPIKPITVQPGEVIYLGKLRVKGLQNDQIVHSMTGHKYEVLRDLEAAKAALERTYPHRSTEFIRMLQIRPFEVVQQIR